MRNLNLAKKKLLPQSLKWSAFLLLMMLTLMSASMFIVTPLILNNMIRGQGTIGIINIAIIVPVLVAGHAIEAGNVFLKNKLIQKYHVETAIMLYHNIFKLSYDAYLKMEPSKIQQKVYNAVDSYAQFFFGTIPKLIVSTIMILVTLTIVMITNPIIALLMFSTLPLNYFGYKALNKKLAKLSIELNNVCSSAWKDENSIISQVDFIKQNPDNDYLLPLIRKQRNLAQDITKKVNNYAKGVSTILSASNLVIKNLLILFLAIMMLEDASFVGDALFIILILPYFTSAVSGLTSMNLNISAIRVADAFIKEVEEAVAPDGKVSIDEIRDICIALDEVSIEGKILIRDVSIRLNKGDVVGVIGESGKGKSTLAKLIMRFRPCNGIYVNGVSISTLRNDDYLKLVSYYSQNAPIISDTVLSNLNFGREPVAKQTYEKLNFLSKFSNLDEVILENGANLSGGDKQRISLSRYFSEKAEIVILDEPTNSLDKVTEHEILSEIFEKKDEKIVFLITHNQENLRFCTHKAEIKNERLILTKL